MLCPFPHIFFSSEFQWRLLGTSGPRVTAQLRDTDAVWIVEGCVPSDRARTGSGSTLSPDGDPQDNMVFTKRFLVLRRVGT